MKAVQMSQFGSPGVLEYVDLETPKPGPGQVLVRAESISVNLFDAHVHSGDYPMWRAPLPAILGEELSGFVEALGDGVSGLQPRQPVVILRDPLKESGCYAEYVVADVSSVVPIPEGTDMDQAAAFPLAYLTAYHALHTFGRLERGQTILSHAAAGGLGMAVGQLAKLVPDVTAIGLTSTDDKVQFAKSQGYDYVINYKTENVARRVMDLTDGKGVDLILNSVGGTTFPENMETLAHRGIIVSYGTSAGPPQGNLVELLLQYVAKGPSIAIFRMFNSVAEPFPDLFRQSFLTMVDHLASGRILPHIYDRLPLAQAARSHELLESGKVIGKLILKP